jgi:hypothetical protein
MARSDARYSIYPASKATEIIGDTAPALNQAVECWAALLSRATADNSNKIVKSRFSDLGGGRIEVDYLHEWGVLADTLREMRFDPEFANPSFLLASAVEDAQRLQGVGFRWLEPSLNFDGSLEVNPAIFRLIEKIKNMDYAHAWAIIVAVQWYWENHEMIAKEDEWWTLAYRREKPFHASEPKTKTRKRKAH